MFDWLRGLTKSAEDRRQERTIAYVDDRLSEQERVQFEAEMARDVALRQEVDELMQIKRMLRNMPRQRVPRNFTLDPAVYGKPDTANDVRFYPVLQAATALSALLFIIMATLTLSPQLGGGVDTTAMAPADVETVAESIVVEVEDRDSAADATIAEDSAEMAESIVVEEEAALAMQDDPAANSVATPQATADPAPSMAREVVIPQGDEDVASDEFRLSPLESPTPAPQPTLVPTADPAELALELTVEVAASETAPESKDLLQTEIEQIETLDASGSLVDDQAPTLTLYLAVVFAVLAIALLAATLWVRSRL